MTFTPRKTQNTFVAPLKYCFSSVFEKSLLGASFFLSSHYVPTRVLGSYLPTSSKYVSAKSFFRGAPPHSSFFSPMQKILLKTIAYRFRIFQSTALFQPYRVFSYKTFFDVDKHNYSQMLERDSGSWCSVRRKLRLPMRGQRSKTNSRTSKKGHRTPFASVLPPTFALKKKY